jgi:hypothetical protein
MVVMAELEQIAMAEKPVRDSLKGGGAGGGG